MPDFPEGIECHVSVLDLYVRIDDQLAADKTGLDLFRKFETGEANHLEFTEHGQFDFAGIVHRVGMLSPSPVDSVVLVEQVGQLMVTAEDGYLKPVAGPYPQLLDLLEDDRTGRFEVL
jgi:hypothetical protein